jgi:hypothetical protein
VFALKRTKQCGYQIKKRENISISRQFLEQLYFAICDFIPPRAYYFYGLYRPSNRKKATSYIHHHEIIEILPFLNRNNKSYLLDDKRMFFVNCVKHGLPTIPIIAEFENGRMKTPNSPNDLKLPQEDLLAKPAYGVCGQGVKSWAYHDSGSYCSDDGSWITGSELLNQLKKLSQENPYILQKRLFNHPDLYGLSNGGLCTIRVVTCREPNGSTEHLGSLLRMPTGIHITDNFASGGIASPLGSTDGKLGTAISKDLNAVRIEKHPDTGTKIVGVKIPYWKEAIALCIKAHGAFPKFASLGWDVAVTKKGPILVETNPTWCVELMQRTQNKPLGDTRFAEILLRHLYK